MKQSQTISRSEFLKDIGRVIVVGAFTAGVAALVNRPSRPHDTCVSNGICSRCSGLHACALPQAMSARQGLSSK